MKTAYDRDRALVQWSLAVKAIELVCHEAHALGGLVLHGFHGPVREKLIKIISAQRPLTRLAANATIESLEGGIDTSATLAQGKLVRQPGLLEKSASGILLIPAAERLDSSINACLSRWLENRTANTANTILIALDESLPGGTSLIDTSLGERMALHVAVPDLALEDLSQAPETSTSSGASTGRIHLPDNLIDEITTLSARLAVTSLRSTIQACQCAKVCAAIDDRLEVGTDDMAIAAQLVLASRARQFPESDIEPLSDEQDKDDSDEQPEQEQKEQEPQQEPQTPLEQESFDASNDDELDPDTLSNQEPEELQEQLIEAVAAALPHDILNALISRQSQSQANSGSDSARMRLQGRHGRPVGVRRSRGDLHRERLDLPATLKTAIPWQSLRPATNGARLSIRMDDLRVRRFKQSTRTTTLFVVDASGSAAMHRLAEAKGAVENLLSECYIRRDRVALLTFRGVEATLELPPTRSLVLARRRLAGLPGGGGTPLAAGLDLAHQLIGQLQQAGENPMAIFMTDAKANIARDGSASRLQAQTDAEQSARALAETGARLLFVDTATRPRPIAARLAEVMRARYLPLPQLNTRHLPETCSSAKASSHR